MRIKVLTIFPELFEPFLSTSLVGRATERSLLAVEVHDLRDFTDDRHRSVDDEPYGGGGGMVMTAPPFLRAVRRLAGSGEAWRILPVPFVDAFLESVDVAAKQIRLRLPSGLVETCASES